MRRVNFLLRIWVIVGAALLLLQTPRGGQGYAEYEPGSCINIAISQPSCPSGCTESSFTQMTMASVNGIYYLEVKSTTPCGSAKKGETCNNPTQYYWVYDFQDCCAALQLDCTGVGISYMNCCSASAMCVAGKCCIPDSYYGCSEDSDCCSGGPCYSDGQCGGTNCGQYGGACIKGEYPPCCFPGVCYNDTCCPPGCPFSGCSDPGAYCWAACGCPGSDTCSDCYTACVDEMTAGCESACQQCGICCPS